MEPDLVRYGADGHTCIAKKLLCLQHADLRHDFLKALPRCSTKHPAKVAFVVMKRLRYGFPGCVFVVILHVL